MLSLCNCCYPLSIATGSFLPPVPRDLMVWSNFWWRSKSHGICRLTLPLLPRRRRRGGKGQVMLVLRSCRRSKWGIACLSMCVYCVCVVGLRVCASDLCAPFEPFESSWVGDGILSIHTYAPMITSVLTVERGQNHQPIWDSTFLARLATTGGMNSMNRQGGEEERAKWVQMLRMLRGWRRPCPDPPPTLPSRLGPGTWDTRINKAGGLAGVKRWTWE